MVKGIDRFRAHFADHEHQYVLIGGAACELLMDEAGLDFRATKDLDIVLIVEALDPAFAESFWSFIEEGGYDSHGALSSIARTVAPFRHISHLRPALTVAACFDVVGGCLGRAPIWSGGLSASAWWPRLTGSQRDGVARTIECWKLRYRAALCRGSARAETEHRGARAQ